MEEDDEAEAPQELPYQWSPFESLMIQKMDTMLHSIKSTQLKFIVHWRT